MEKKADGKEHEISHQAKGFLQRVNDLPDIHDGRYEILSLEGVLSLKKSNDGRGRRGVMTAYLAVPDRRLVGGTAQSLIAANPVEVTMFHFHLKDGKEKGPSNDSLGVNGNSGSSYDGCLGPCTNANNRQPPSYNMSMQSHQSQGNSTMNDHGKLEIAQEIRIKAQESLIKA